MTYLKTLRLRLPVYATIQRYIPKLNVGIVGCVLIVIAVTLPCGIVMGEQEPNNLDSVKKYLEIEKTRLEISKLKEDIGLSPKRLLTFAGGVLTGAVSLWLAGRARVGALDQSVHDKRLEFYPGLVNATAGLAIYFPPSASIDPKQCETMGRAMSNWYFGGGGLLMSDEAFDAYLKLVRALTLASRADRLNIPRSIEALDITTTKICNYRYELQIPERVSFDYIEGWIFGGDKQGDDAFNFKDFVFLQKLGNTLKTMLSDDLRSRRRPSRGI